VKKAHPTCEKTKNDLGKWGGGSQEEHKPRGALNSSRTKRKGAGLTKFLGGEKKGNEGGNRKRGVRIRAGEAYYRSPERQSVAREGEKKR